jgi:hypothetical protein
MINKYIPGKSNEQIKEEIIRKTIGEAGLVTTDFRMKKFMSLNKTEQKRFMVEAVIREEKK